MKEKHEKNSICFAVSLFIQGNALSVTKSINGIILIPAG
jgi:hypothetical protein